MVWLTAQMQVMKMNILPDVVVSNLISKYFYLAKNMRWWQIITESGSTDAMALTLPCVGNWMSLLKMFLDANMYMSNAVMAYSVYPQNMLSVSFSQFVDQGQMSDLSLLIIDLLCVLVGFPLKRNHDKDKSSTFVWFMRMWSYRKWGTYLKGMNRDERRIIGIPQLMQQEIGNEVVLWGKLQGCSIKPWCT